MSVVSPGGFEMMHSAPQLGSVEHIKCSAELLAELDLRTTHELQAFLLMYNVPESLAYYIFQNQTPKPPGIDRSKTAALDTRDLPGYRKTSPIFSAEFQFDPFNDNNYVYIYGRPLPFESTPYNYAYTMRIQLENSHEPALPIEARLFRGHAGQVGVYESYTFRTQSYDGY